MTTYIKRSKRSSVPSDVLNLLGLAYRAKKVALGDDAYTCLTNASVKYLFIASDASAKTKERLYKKIYYYKLAYDDSFSSYDLSNALGKNNIKVIAIIDEGFKDAIVRKGGIKNGETES